MKVLVFGTFDHLHPGHLSFLQQASARGELTVAISRDTNVEHIKGRSPDQSEAERKETVERVVPHAQVIFGDPDDYLVPVQDVRPDLILLGYDQSLPPGITESDLGCKVERTEAFQPETYKSSLKRANEGVN